MYVLKINFKFLITDIHTKIHHPPLVGEGVDQGSSNGENRSKKTYERIVYLQLEA